MFAGAFGLYTIIANSTNTNRGTTCETIFFGASQ